MDKKYIIEKAKETHSIDYDYSLVESCNLSDNVKIICKKHGLFTPRLNRFLKGSNCPYCAGKIKSNKEDFVEKANKIHNNFYSYEHFNYVDSHTKSYITCPIHGDFLQSPTNHLSGCGCKECKSDKLKLSFTSNKEDFVKKANKIHNNFYSYEHFNYSKSSEQSYITCPIHGDFIQSPNNHLKGEGCPLCKQSHLENEIMKCLNENNIKYTRQKKFEWLGRQSLDFFLEDYNISIECQGRQHFIMGGFINESSFKTIIENDIKKKKLCDENNVKLYYFSNDNLYADSIVSTIYDKNNLFFSTNDILNILGINQIKNDIISLFNEFNIEYVENLSYLSVNNVHIYPLSNIDSFKNSTDKNYFNIISIENERNGIRTIWIKPYEWFNDNKRNILSSFILSSCGIILNKYYARDCYIKELKNKDIKSFLNRTSMYGYRNSSLILGLFAKKDKGNIKKDTLLMCYTFGKAYYGKGKYDIEVIRASTELFTQVIGGASKLWSYFIKNYKTIKINNENVEWKTCCYYVDFDHNNGNSLKYLGFEFSHYTRGGFHNITNDSTKKINRLPSKHKTIKELIDKKFLFTIYNAGTKVYIYTKNV